MSVPAPTRSGTARHRRCCLLRLVGIAVSEYPHHTRFAPVGQRCRVAPAGAYPSFHAPAVGQFRSAVARRPVRLCHRRSPTGRRQDLCAAAPASTARACGNFGGRLCPTRRIHTAAAAGRRHRPPRQCPWSRAAHSGPSGSSKNHIRRRRLHPAAGHRSSSARGMDICTTVPQL